jgi:TetR/AcrR family transcriptional regulator, regulator of cefoperazone and chloramphenicol sensitivity
VRSATLPEADLTTKARIRETAMELFARRGVAATSLRAVARAAEVSPALVVHHFGSKQGLCEAVDEAVVERFTARLRSARGEDLLPRRAALLSELIRREPVVCDYIARALAEGTEASADLFHRMFAVASADAELVASGVLRPTADPAWRALQQIVLVVGPLMLRPLVERELGSALYDQRSVDRWMQATVDLLEHGLYATG